MKKIYSLLAAVGIAATAYALPTTQKLDCKLAQPLDVTIAKQQQPIMSYGLDANDGKMKIVDKNTKKNWAIMIAILGPWPLYEEDPETGEQIPTTIESFPYYQTLISFQPNFDGDPGLYPIFFNWPALGAMDDDCWVTDGNSNKFSAEKAREKYGERALQPMTYDELVEAWTSTEFFTLPGWYHSPGIIGPEAAGPSYQVTCADGVKRYIKSAFIDGDRWNISEATTLNWSAYDQDAFNIDLVFDGKFTSSLPTANGAVEATLNCDFSGDAVMLGFADIFWDSIGQIHIFNGGRQAEGDPWTWNYNQFNEPLNFYYLTFCDNTMAYQGWDQDGNELTNYTDMDLPTLGSGADVNYGAPGFPLVEDYHLSFFGGTIWAPENAENPYGIWTMKDAPIDANDETAYDQTPEAFNLIVSGGNDAASQMEGFHGLYEGYGQYPVPGKTFVAIGDKELGLNFKIETTTNYNHSIQGYSTNEIYYHGTPDQWMKFEKIPSTSDGTYNVLTSSVTKVESDAPVVSRSFYNFQGQRLNSEPENGMYIIRSVKADGTVKAEKVAK